LTRQSHLVRNPDGFDVYDRNDQREFMICRMIRTVLLGCGRRYGSVAAFGGRPAASRCDVYARNTTFCGGTGGLSMRAWAREEDDTACGAAIPVRSPAPRRWGRSPERMDGGSGAGTASR